jgi:hypothetical protein
MRRLPPLGVAKVRCSARLAPGAVEHTGDSPSKNNINSGKNQFELRVGKLARSIREKMLVKSDDLRHVCNGVLGESSKAGL